MKQIVCLSHSRWNTRPNRTQQILTRLPNTKILFFEPPGKDTQRNSGLRVRSNVVVYSLPLALGGEHSLVRKRNEAKIADFIQNVMDQHHFRDPLLWCTTPQYAFLLDALSYRCLVYDCQREWDDLPLDWESELAIAADVIFAASPGLVERLSPCSDNIALLPNGVNHQMFFRDELIPPRALRNLPRPIFARVGDIFADLELDPVIFAAQRQPEWTFLFIGRVSRQAMRTLTTLSNVVLTGAVPSVELPDHLVVCDVLFDLLRTSRRNSDVIPGRVYEYLATEKPVVLMGEPQLPEPFPDIVYTAYDGREFLRDCRDALAEQDPRKAASRLACARDASWSTRAQTVARILDSI